MRCVGRMEGQGQGREGQGQGLNLWDCVEDGKAFLRSCWLCVKGVWIEQLGVLDGEGFDLCAGV